VRCFVAIELPDDVRSVVAAAQAALRRAAPRADVRWTTRDQWHLTLRFLGEVPDADIPGLVERLAAAVRPRPSLALALSGVGGFPGRRRPRVVWCGVEGDAAALGETAAVVEAAVRAFGLPEEGRPFHAHVTVGRVRSPRGLGRLGAALEAPPDAAPAAWTAREAVLFRSRLRPTGAVYEPIARLPFAGRPAAART
jgi:2'-5' RNA ligase